MRFVQVKDLREGMRIAKPIYNQKGVLLFGRGVALRNSAIVNIESLNLFGLYILEPTEPLPPITEEEEEFERFQAASSFALADGLADVLNGDLPRKIETLAADIQKRYGNLNRKINFMQSIRNPNDHVYRHSVNVAILTALISHKLKISRNDQLYLIVSALLHDIGKLMCPDELLNKTGKLTYDELTTIRQFELDGYNLIRNNYMLPSGIRRFFIQMSTELLSKMEQAENDNDSKILLGTKIIKIADLFDILTAMRVYKDPMSEFAAVTYMLEREYEFDENVVEAIISSINILPVGACVDLTNGEKALIIKENEATPLRPTVLSLGKNQVYDLGLRSTYETVKISDIIKTMDNRFVMSPELVDKFYASNATIK
ncbi:MAG: HD domain-containing protein [Lachnospiraceae bacterium]|nr:HD domain-containing protein [Lachnospiraceae bacterium]